MRTREQIEKRAAELKEKMTKAKREREERVKAVLIEAGIDPNKSLTPEEDARLRNIAKCRAYRQRHRLKTSIFKVKFTEGKKVIDSILSGRSKEIEFDEEEQSKIMELVAMLTQPELLIKYHTWKLRAVALGVTPQRLYTYRHSKFFHRLLIEAIRNEALIGVAAALPNQVAMASDPESNKAASSFKRLMEISGIEGPRSVNISQTNITFEQQLRDEAIKVIDASE